MSIHLRDPRTASRHEPPKSEPLKQGQPFGRISTGLFVVLALLALGVILRHPPASHPVQLTPAMPIEQVEAEFGEPLYHYRDRINAETWIYPGGKVIWFADGKVVDSRGFSADSPALPNSPTKPGRYVVLPDSKGRYVIQEVDPSATYIIGRSGERFSLPPATAPSAFDSLKSQWGWNNSKSPLNQSAHR